MHCGTSERSATVTDVMPDVVAAEGAALPNDAPAPDNVAVSPLAALFTAHVIPEGEIVILLLKPSLLFIPLAAAYPLGIAAVITLAPLIFNWLPGKAGAYLNVSLVLAAVALMASTLQWMGRYYVLTDLRIMSLAGVFHTTVHQCMLRKVARVRLLRTFRDSLLRHGSIEIIPQQEEMPIVLWQTLATPKQIKERLQQAVARAKSTGRGA